MAFTVSRRAASGLVSPSVVTTSGRRRTETVAVSMMAFLQRTHERAPEGWAMGRAVRRFRMVRHAPRGGCTRRGGTAGAVPMLRVLDWRTEGAGHSAALH